MQNISYQQIIAVLGMSIWFIFPIGMFISIVKQDRESLPSPELNTTKHKPENLKIFGHKAMIYNDESEDILYPDEEERQLREEDFNHPHAGVGATHPHSPSSTSIT